MVTKFTHWGEQKVVICLGNEYVSIQRFFFKLYMLNNEHFTARYPPKTEQVKSQPLLSITMYLSLQRNEYNMMLRYIVDLPLGLLSRLQYSAVLISYLTP
jgi:hypothetical protein